MLSILNEIDPCFVAFAVCFVLPTAFFKRKAPEANANFCVFESQCPKITVLSKALKAKLSLILSGLANLSMLGLDRNRKLSL